MEFLFNFPLTFTYLHIFKFSFFVRVHSRHTEYYVEEYVTLLFCSMYIVHILYGTSSARALYLVRTKHGTSMLLSIVRQYDINYQLINLKNTKSNENYKLLKLWHCRSSLFSLSVNYCFTTVRRNKNRWSRPRTVWKMVKRAMLSIYDLTIVVLYVYQSGCLHEKNGGDECNTRPGCCFDFDGAACVFLFFTLQGSTEYVRVNVLVLFWKCQIRLKEHFQSLWFSQIIWILV